MLQFDAAAASGLDADDPRAAALSGKGGAIIQTTDDVRRALDGVLLDVAGAWLEAGSAAVPAAALYVAAAKQAGVGPDRLLGSFASDPLGTLVHEGALPMPLETALKQTADLAAWTAANAPRLTSVLVSTKAYHDAGATSAQDLAFLLATGVEYLRALTASGLDVDTAARQITFSIELGCRFYQATAKIRAARLLWDQVVAASGGSEAARRTHVHTTTGRRVLTTRNPMLTILRNTATAYAGAIGGADAITTVPVDAPDVLSADQSRRNARNTQLILAEECHLNHVIDPAGGSWYIEWYTSHLAEQAWALFQEIEAEGGMIAAVTSGWVAHKIEAVEAKRERDIATRKLAITGISEHANVSEGHVHHTPAKDPAALRAAAADTLAGWRATHEPKDALARLADAAAASHGRDRAGDRGCRSGCDHRRTRRRAGPAGIGGLPVSRRWRCIRSTRRMSTCATPPTISRKSTAIARASSSPASAPSRSKSAARPLPTASSRPAASRCWRTKAISPSIRRPPSSPPAARRSR